MSSRFDRELGRHQRRARTHGGDGIPVSEWARTYDLAQERALTRMSEGETVVIDDTSSPRFLRDDWRSLCASLGAPMVLVFVDTPEEIIRHWHMANRITRHRRDVKDEVMAAHQESFEPPEADEQAVRLATGPGSFDLDELCTTALNDSVKP